ncbi:MULTISPECIES: DUF4919 domain-containing protein [Chryseobacterium]|uniref:DUF4919 domain-containing protein n=1 Tax=Chryseobacterium camelliae TaxID=1265445 RepID=A0ABU0TM38_9FLAO|nr:MULTISPECIES: DUF4919 domain-containing protein [Chryseobacterium]MDT3408032.1 hypothetical protein [Pseudacidovorax intermedius]MDQ1098113.1 hypothetical protein [Chryseobacterium camelliae]MDQ1102043.1 hypothetical protein [Chryseobacterium sp. SORGH_AS_1048]MDR6085479.1 hypothetical protein [Chryseobacterium sp. SORGH_AS_0909]MDR6129843.1 hypothetical protein [Chryseobacterium sp. SORGH_AS_1175]
MKNYFFFLLILWPVFGFSQKSGIDLKSIDKDLKDSASPYFYEKLIFKYKGFTESLDSLEAQHLYYGRNFSKDRISTTDERFEQLAQAFKDKNFDECIRQGKVLYDKDPTNLDVLLILLRAYDAKQDKDNFIYHLSQLRSLTGAIRSSGDGKSEKTAYLVNSVGDEYILLNMLNIGQGYTKASKSSKDGIMDIWEKENNKIYIKVFYLNL